MNKKFKCRLCSSKTDIIIDMGTSPIANNFIKKIGNKFSKHKLIISFCKKCYNIQLEKTISPKILYSDYTYITPDVPILNNHYDKIIKHLILNKYINKKSSALEIGSNAGYFLKRLKSKIKNVLGIDPAQNIQAITKKNKIPTIIDFFNFKSSVTIKKKYGYKDFIIARHMFAHNPYPNIIMKGIDNLLTDNGVILIENAYVIPTLINGEFDQIYHEHMFYYSLISIDNFLNKFSFELIDAKGSNVHGGTVCFIASRKKQYKIKPIINLYKKREYKYFEKLYIFKLFIKKTYSLKKNILQFINKERKKNRRIASYGASAKAFTMFSFLELDNKLVDYCIDTTETKIGKFFPKFNIPVISEENHKINPADTFLITSWNYKKHILTKKKKIFKTGDKLIFPLPQYEIIEIK